MEKKEANKQETPKQADTSHKEKNAAEQNPSQEYLEQLKRVQAEFENYVKRIAKEREHIELLAKEKIFSQLIGIIDDFHRAVHNAVNTNKEELSQGIMMIAKRLDKFLEEQGVKCINCKGQPFDPYKHEAILQVENPLPEGFVVEEIQPGWSIGDKVIRYAKVTVSKNKETKESEQK